MLSKFGFKAGGKRKDEDRDSGTTGTCSSQSLSKSKLNKKKSGFRLTSCLNTNSEEEDRIEDECEQHSDTQVVHVDKLALNAESKLSELRTTPVTMSSVWKFFKKEGQYRSCNLCSTKLKYCGSTSSFVWHLTQKHSEEYSKYIKSVSYMNLSINTIDRDADKHSILKTKKSNTVKKIVQSGLTKFMTTVTPYDKTSQRKKKLDDEIALFICRDMQPLSIVENQGFCDLICKLDPRYKLPSRKTLTYMLIPELYKRAKRRLTKMLSNTNTVSITTDSWTSMSNESYVGVTCHFFNEKMELCSVILDVLPILKDETADSLVTLLNDCFMYWNIHTKVKHIVTDNAPVMKATIDKLTHIRHFPCAAHSLNLVMKNSIQESQKGDEELRQALTKTSSLVTFFHHSPKASRELKKLKLQSAEEGELPAGKFIQWVETRWSSLINMIDSVLSNDDAMRLLFSTQNYSDRMSMLLTQHETDILNDIKNLLSPFKQAINDLSGDTYPTVNLIIPAIKGIIWKLKKVNLKTTSGEVLLVHISKNNQKYLDLYEERSVSRLATFLDARWKASGFCFQHNFDEARKLLENILKTHLQNKNSSSHLSITPSSENENDSITKVQEDSIFSFREEIKESRVQSSRADAVKIIDEYLRKENIAIDKEPVLYLHTFFPELYEVALPYFETPGSSVPCERLFSASGQIVTLRRNRLSAENVKKLCFLNQNYNLARIH